MKIKTGLLSLLTILTISTFTSCGGNEKTIRICASEVPHAKILKEVIAPILKDEGYTLEVSVLDWTEQNSALSAGDYDANYFQHIPYLETYNQGVSDSAKLEAACKVHYEKLCLYSSSLDNKEIKNNSKICLVDDPSNAERALQLLESNNILIINPTSYVNGTFSFDSSNPHASITLLEGYENVELTCIPEETLCASLPDYDFGVIPGNTMMLGYSDFLSRIVFGEENNETIIDEKANIIAVRGADLHSEKTLALVKACGDERVNSYVSSTFGEAVTYHYVDLTK